MASNRFAKPCKRTSSASLALVMTDGAFLKIGRAAKHVADLNELLRKARPFPLVLKTDTQTGERTLGCEKNEPVIDMIALLCGDAIHNLRSALDHAYWEIVSPQCPPKEYSQLQFPFCETEDGLDEAIKKRRAHYAGTGFVCALRRIRPFRDDVTGNIPLAMIHELDVTDKHRLLLPTIDESTLTFDWINTIDPKAPWSTLRGSSVTLSEQAPLTWTNKTVPPDQLGVEVAPHIFKRILDVPIKITFPPPEMGGITILQPPLIPMLYRMVNTAAQTIQFMREAARSC